MAKGGVSHVAVFYFAATSLAYVYSRIAPAALTVTELSHRVVSSNSKHRLQGFTWNRTYIMIPESSHNAGGEQKSKPQDLIRFPHRVRNRPTGVS